MLVYRTHWSTEHRDSNPVISAPSIDAGLQNTLVYRTHWSREHRDSSPIISAPSIDAGLQNTLVYRRHWSTEDTGLQNTEKADPTFWLRGYMLVYRTLVYRTWSTEHRDSSSVAYWHVLTAGDKGLVGSWWSTEHGLQNTGLQNMVYRTQTAALSLTGMCRQLGTKVWLDLGGLQNSGLQNTGLQNMVYRTERQQPCHLLACADSWGQRSGWILASALRHLSSLQHTKQHGLTRMDYTQHFWQCPHLKA